MSNATTSNNTLGLCLAQYRASMDAVAEILKQREGLKAALATAEAQAPKTREALKIAQEDYSRTLVTAPGSQQETLARAALGVAKQNVEALEDRIAALGSALRESEGLMAEKQHKQAAQSATIQAWQAIQQTAEAAVPKEAREVLVRGFAAYCRSGAHVVDFGAYLARVLGNPSIPELDANYADLVKQYSLPF